MTALSVSGTTGKHVVHDAHTENPTCTLVLALNDAALKT